MTTTTNNQATVELIDTIINQRLQALSLTELMQFRQTLTGDTIKPSIDLDKALVSAVNPQPDTKVKAKPKTATNPVQEVKPVISSTINQSAGIIDKLTHFINITPSGVRPHKSGKPFKTVIDYNNKTFAFSTQRECQNTLDAALKLHETMPGLKRNEAGMLIDYSTIRTNLMNQGATFYEIYQDGAVFNLYRNTKYINSLKDVQSFFLTEG